MSPDTYRVLEALAAAVDGMTAAELQRELEFDGRPVNRLNYLARHGLVQVDRFDQRWWILHAGFGVVAARIGRELEDELRASWDARRSVGPGPCPCPQCTATRRVSSP